MSTLDVDLNLKHPVELVFAQVIEQHTRLAKSLGEPAHPANITEARDLLVALIEQVVDGPPVIRPGNRFPIPRLSQSLPRRLLRECVEVFRERTQKYAGSLDDWDATFVRAAEIHGCTPSLIAEVHVAVKIARREMGDGADHDDDSIRDSVIDEVNYRILGIALDRVHGSASPPSSAEDVRVFRERFTLPRHSGRTEAKRAQSLIDLLVSDRSPYDLRIKDSLKEMMSWDQDARSTTLDEITEHKTEDEHERIGREALQATILSTYDHLRGLLDSANHLQGVNHWRIPLKEAVKALRPAVEELRTCPTCGQPTTKDVT